MKDNVITAVASAHGGVRVAHNKNTMDMTAQRMPPPQRVVLPMLQHIGKPCTPLVKVGDHVKVGQKIGDSTEFLTVPIHATVSGNVTSVGEIKNAGGATVTAVTIESDGLMELYEGIEPPKVTNAEELLAAVRESGVVGLGGAGFPTHVKLKISPQKPIDTLIINAAECEPYITVDYREILDNKQNVMDGVFRLKELLGIKQVIVAAEDNKPIAIRMLSGLAAKHEGVKIMALKSRYPQGAEKMMIYSATGRKVPVGGLPADVGCIVMNVATVAFIERYIQTGKPLVSRSITVDGSAINYPQNLRVPIGTRLQDIVDYCGGFTKDPEKIILGGPMMGASIYNLEAPLCKQNNAILAFADADIKPQRACINCGRCVAACPMNLTPTFIRKYVIAKNTQKLSISGINVCMECGCCAYSCPSGIPLVQYMRLAKQLLREESKK